MNFIRLSFLTLLLYGCSANNLLITRSLNALKTNEVDIQFYRDLSYASILFSLEDNPYVLVLGDGSQDRSRWYSADSSNILTKNYKVIGIRGFTNDFTIHYPPSLKEIFLELMSNKNSLSSNFSAFISFSNPKTTLLEISFLYTLDKTSVVREVLASGRNRNLFMMREDYEIPSIGYKGTNYYWISANGVVHESKQDIISLKKKARIQAIKYSGFDN